MSLRFRLVLAVGAVAVIALVVADVATYSALGSFLLSRIDGSLQTSHLAIENAVRQAEDGQSPGPGGGRPGPDNNGGSPFSAPTVAGCVTASDSSPPVSGPLAAATPDTFIEIRNASGAVVQCVPDERLTTYTPKLPAAVTGLAVTSVDSNEPTKFFTVDAAQAGGPQFRVRASTLQDGGLLILATPLDQMNATLDRLVLIELAVTGGALLFAGVVGWWLVRVGLRPLTAIERTAEAIADGQLQERAPGEDAPTEVGRVARALNVMLGRIERAFAQRDATEDDLRQSEQRMRQFVADASHELRTPLAAVSAYAELFERGASDRQADLARVMSGIRGESARMARLVDDLMLLAHLDEGQPLRVESVDLCAVVSEALQTAATVGPQWPTVLDAPHAVVIDGDASRLLQVVDNLLANVRAHTPAGTRTTVTVAREPAGARLEVADDGPGMAAADVGHVFERFFRTDPSRTRSTGGAGLGLSIVTSIVAAHGGSVVATSAEGRGLHVVVHLPARHVLADGEATPGALADGTGPASPNADLTPDPAA